MPIATEPTPSFDAPPFEPASPQPAAEPAGDPSRTGALWVGATGVSLLLAAAAVLTAVRWGEIGQTAKLGGLVAITLVMLLGGRRLQSTIPLTGRAIFHLGALLIPLDMAAVAVLADRTWQETLLLTSVTAVAAWFALVRVDASPVLEWAARGSVVLAAAGVAAVSPLSMPLVLAVVALGATVMTVGVGIETSGRSATTWTLVAGLLPIAAFQRWPVQLAPTIEDLGFLRADRPQLVVAGVIAALVAAALARWQPSLERGWMVVLLTAVSAITTAAMFTDVHAWWVSLAGFFLLVELAALATRRDPMWRQIVAVVAPTVEVIAGLGTIVVLVDALLISTSTTLLVSAALLSLGWLTADRRRLLDPNDWLVGLLFGADWRPATFLIPATVLAVVAASPGSGLVMSVVALASGTWAIVTGRGDSLAVAKITAIVAIVFTNAGWTGAGVFAAAALVLAVGARFQLRRGDDAAALLASAFASLFVIGLLAPLSGLVEMDVGVTAIAVVGWALGWVVSPNLNEPATFPTRAVSVLSLGVTWLLEPVGAIVLAIVVAALAAFDAWRTQRWTPTIITGIAVGLTGLPLGELIGFSAAEAGVMMTAAAMVTVGLQIVLPQRMELPLGALALTLCIVGLGAASATVAMLAPALMLVGGAVVLFGAATNCPPIIGAGALTVTAGTWMQLAVWDVMWVEAYLALPALAALWAGSIWHRNGLTSWVAYAPTIAIFGLVAAVDRFDGGSAWHAVLAGGVGVLAVLAGGWWRLAGPLITGTALISAVAIFESLGPGSRVPTWGWLALGGAVLLAAAVQMERSETTPLEQGQRVVEVLATRFS